MYKRWKGNIFTNKLFLFFSFVSINTFHHSNPSIKKEKKRKDKNKPWHFISRPVIQESTFALSLQLEEAWDAYHKHEFKKDCLRMGQLVSLICNCKCWSCSVWNLSELPSLRVWYSAECNGGPDWAPMTTADLLTAGIKPTGGLGEVTWHSHSAVGFLPCVSVVNSIPVCVAVVVFVLFLTA